MLQQIIHNKLLPQVKNSAAKRIIVARKKMRMVDMPEGVELKYRKLEGKRVVVKGGRLYGNTRLISAQWPEVGMHEVEAYRLVSVIEGHVHFCVSNYRLGCKEGDFLLIPPGIPHPANRHPPHLITSDLSGRSCTLLWMASYRRGFQCWLSHYDEYGKRLNKVTGNYLFLDGQVIELFRLLTDEASGAKDASLCDGLLLAFFSALRRETDAKQYSHPGPAAEPGAPPAKGNDFTCQLNDYIGQHLSQSLTSAQVARELYMSRTQFIRRMRQEIGQSFVEFLTAYRIREAKTLLRESEWTSQAITKFVGFKSPAYFHALFLRQVGCTPGEYRRKISKSDSFPKKDQ